MSAAFETGEPRSGPEIRLALERLHEMSQSYAASLAPSVFAQPQGEKWSPADHLRHLSKSSRALLPGLGMPKLALRLMFGGSRGSSRAFVEVRETYQAGLRAGATAGRFAPSAKPLPPDPAAWQAEVLSSFRNTASALHDALAPWPEKALDRYRLPHPLLGRLTVREMLFFTLYHNAHHMNLVAGRVDGSVSA